MTHFPFIQRDLNFRKATRKARFNCYGELIKHPEPDKEKHGWEEPITNEEVKEEEDDSER